MTDIYLEKSLPSNLEAERAILGAILLDNAIPTDVRVEDFYLDSHRRIIRAMQGLADHNEPINLISVKSALQISNELEATGGAAYLASLTDGMPNIELAPQYFRIIRRQSALRRLIQMGNETMALGYAAEEEPQDIISHVIEVCDVASGILDEKAGLIPVSEFVSPVFSEIEARSNHKSTNVYATGFSELDRLLSGGPRPKNDMIIAGRPGHGKTALATCMMLNMGAQGIPCAYFSLEMGAYELVERMLSVKARVDGQRFRTGFLNKDEWYRLTQAAGELCQLPIWIDDSTGITVADMRSRIRKIKQKIKVVYVDYLQLVNPPTSMRRNADDNSQTAEISKSLKFMAKSMDLAVIPLSQLSRASEKRRDQTPQLSDLRNSGQIEQDADIVLFVYREELNDPTEENGGIALIKCAKQRNGPVGDVQLAFIRQFTSFNDLYQENY